MAHLIKELNGLDAEELEEVFEEMTADTSIELYGNIYMVQTEGMTVLLHIKLTTRLAN
mgnify:CR=1 FL=1